MSLPVAILAGGLATRLRPVTETVPKALVAVAGEPFVFHQLRQLKRQGIGEVVLCLGHLGEQVEAAVGEGRQFGLRARYSYDGPTLLGTGGALKKALPLLGDAFFVLYGDSYLTVDYGVVEAAWRESGQPALMTVYRNEGRWDTSNVEYAGGRVRVYDKRKRTPAMGFIDYGLSVLSAGVIASGPEVFDLAGVLTRLASEGRLAGYEARERFYEIGSFGGLQELEAHLGSCSGDPNR